MPTDPRRDPRLREDCDIVSPIFTHPTSALRLTMVTPVTRQRISAAYLYAGLAVGTLDRYLSFHVGQGTRQKNCQNVFTRCTISRSCFFSQQVESSGEMAQRLDAWKHVRDKMEDKIGGKARHGDSETHRCNTRVTPTQVPHAHRDPRFVTPTLSA